MNYVKPCLKKKHIYKKSVHARAHTHNLFCSISNLDLDSNPNASPRPGEPSLTRQDGHTCLAYTLAFCGLRGREKLGWADSRVPQVARHARLASPRLPILSAVPPSAMYPSSLLVMDNSLSPVARCQATATLYQGLLG